MKRPRIGMNMSTMDLHVLPEARTVLHAAYIDCVARAGGLPVALPPLDSGFEPEMLEGLDGFLLIGGPDYHPHHYGGRVQRGEELMNERRDTFDWALGEYLLKQTELPVFGICGGCQLISIVLRGKLVQDIAKEWPSHGAAKPLPHARDARLKANWDTYRHRVKVETGSVLAETTESQSGSLVTNSYHHQAVRPEALGEGLRATAWAEDGVVEALEPAQDSAWARQERFVVGVQWHPERMPACPRNQGLFRAFVVAARKRG